MADLDLTGGRPAADLWSDVLERGTASKVPGPRAAGDVPDDKPARGVGADSGADGADAGPAVDDLRAQATWAVAVGWTMTTLYRSLAGDVRRSDTPPAHLPGEVELTPMDAAGRHLERIRLGLRRLDGALPASPIVDPLPTVLVEQVQAGLATFRAQPDTADPTQAREAVLALHVRVLSGLSATDLRLGKAYALGAAFADLAADVGARAEEVEDRPVDWPMEELLRLHDEVRDLSTVLPDHVGAPVRESIAFWRVYLQGDFPSRRGRGPDDRSVLLLLQRQILGWKALLLGEKEATDSLTIAEYLTAGLCTVRRIQREAGRVLRAAWPVLAVLAVATAVVIAAAVHFASGTAVSTTVFAAVTTSLGAAWRSTRAPLVRVLDRYSDSLRDAELDAAIARAISVLPPDAPRETIEQKARMKVMVPTERRETARGTVASA
ncbi:MAG TPA: hypothetical protein VLR26_03830 [Frankiaceae bacterium]|nr:hypothetical protein [Frankiaceae bacterium]